MPASATLAQQHASDPNQSVWVAASAGSGKTKVLTDRVLRLLLSGVPPHKILCITYTKAAAAEMQNRIHKRLSKWVMMADEALTAELEALTGQTPSPDLQRRARQLFALMLEAVPNIRIQTIHAFCQSVLARFPMEAGVQPGFSVMEERMSQELLDIAAHRLMQYGDREHVSGDIEERLQQAIKHVSMQLGEWGFDKVLSAIIGKRQAYHRLLRAELPKVELAMYASEGFESCDVTADDFEYLIMPDDKARTTLREIAETLEVDGGKKDVKNAEYYRAFSYVENTPAPEIVYNYRCCLMKQDGDIQTKHIHTKKIRDANPHWVKFLQEKAEIFAEYEERINALKSAQLSSDILHIAATLFGYYSTLKLQRGLMDYDDLILRAHRLICGDKMLPWVLYKLDGGIDHLLLDEAQDTAPMQWQIMEALRDEFFAGEGRSEAERTLFVVGDEKQSIYGFQGADVEGFVIRRLAYRHMIEAQGYPFEEVLMDMSFRSTPAVLAAVDAVFAGDDAKKGVVSDVDYVLKHRAYRAEHPGKVVVQPLVQDVEEARELELVWHTKRQEAMNPTRKLADNMAKMIAGWLREKRQVDGRGREVRPRDIMVLVRRRNDFVEYLSHALKAHGVPVAGADKMALPDHIAVQDLMALLAFLLQPADDLSLASLLKSPLYGLDEETLFLLCDGRGRSTLWEHVHSYAGNGEAVLVAQSELDAMLKKADYITPYALYAELIYARKGRQRFVARMGAAVGEVIASFMEALREYESSHMPNLQGFQAWMRAGGGEINRDLEQLADEVRIMTVHKSKGLQAPIVLLPDTTAVPWAKMKDTLIEDEQGLVKMNRAKGASSAAMLREKDRIIFAAKQEYNRLLYVAMTRAEDELYVMGTQGKIKRDGACWYDAVSCGMHMLEADALEDGTLIYADKMAAATSEEEEKTLYELREMPEVLSLSTAPKEPFEERPKAPSQALGSTEQPAALSPIQVMEWQANQKDVLLAPVERGNVIHRLLQLLPDMPTESREVMARAMLEQVITSDAADKERYIDALIKEVMQVIEHPELAPLFGTGSVAEASVAGRLGDGQLYSAQVDRLVVGDDEIMIADYKTGQPPRTKDDIPSYYSEQMRLYGELLAAIYPDKTITTILIYTALPAHYTLEMKAPYIQPSKSSAS